MLCIHTFFPPLCDNSEMEIRTVDPVFSLDGVLETLGAVGINQASYSSSRINP